jgi:hypothetical protein
LKAGLPFDNPEWMYDFGADMSLDRLDQIIPINHVLFPVQQLSGQGEVMNIGDCGFN